MLSTYQISTIEQGWLLFVILSLISGCYLHFTKSWAKSAHGLIAILGFIYAVIASEYTELSPPEYWYWPIYTCFILSFASVVYSIKAFKGERWFHLIHVVTIPLVILLAFLASMTIAHDWI